MKPIINIVWFKKDLRWQDHEPLARAAAADEPFLLLYIFEPSVQAAPDWALRHWKFIYASLQEMNENLKKHEQMFTIFYGECEDVFHFLSLQFEIKNIFSHQEIGNDVTFKRDKFLKKYFPSQNIVWQESRCNGIIRGLRQRDSWEQSWQKFMSQKIVPLKFNPTKIQSFQHSYLSLPEDMRSRLSCYPSDFQPAGVQAAKQLLITFLEERGKNYSKHISKPEASRASCSRLSPHIAYGNLSVRQVYQATETQLKKLHKKHAINNFISRLHWQSHFIQKFETKSDIEFMNMNTAYDGIEKIYNEHYVTSWKNGQTGFPLVDACMRCVVATGYLNFRMRAMLVSFLTHLLWQDWRVGVHHLAQQFLDYEPGIHYSQFQMQASTTGINMPRIYNPTKQSEEHDPDGIFIKKWVNELANVPINLLHEPAQMTILEQQMYGCWIGKDYPAPIIDQAKAGKFATTQLWEFRKTPEVKLENQKILGKLTTRKKSDMT